MKRFHPARASQEDLALRAKAGDTEAISALAASMMFFIRSIAGKIKQDLHGVERDDLEQVGMIALIRSIPTFDPDKGSFHNRAWEWATTAMEREIYKNTSLVRLPEGSGPKGAIAIASKIRKAEIEDTGTIAEEIGVEEKRVRAIAALLRGHLSIDRGSDDDSHDIPDDTENPEEMAIRKEQITNVQRVLADFRKGLTAKEICIFDYCIIADEEDRLTAVKAGELVGMPRSTACWTCNRLMSRLRQLLGCYYREAA